jgi:hypothetical protein
VAFELVEQRLGVAAHVERPAVVDEARWVQRLVDGRE